MVSMIAKLNQNFFFRYISSIRLAVPVMLALIVAISIGTILESRYNTEYAKLSIYGADWFQLILLLLGLNIFCSMMSRYPWKLHHLGFVITHTGMLILLIGSFITKLYGVDGSMQIQEGQTQNTIVLPQMMIGYQFEGNSTLSSVVFTKTLTEKKTESLDFINNQIGHVLKVSRFIPFAEVEKGYQANGDTTGPIGISFGLKSAFFDVKEWLHSEDNPSYQMGPATLKLVIDDASSSQRAQHETATSNNEPSPQSQRTVSALPHPKPTPSKTKASTSSLNEKNRSKLLIMDAKNQKVLRSITTKELKQAPITIQDVTITADHIFNRAIVSDNKIAENEDPSGPLNPALELTVKKGGEKFREVLYSKYDGFSLHQDGLFGLKFQYQASLEEDPSLSMADSNAATSNATTSLPPGHPPLAGDQSMAGANTEMETHAKANEMGDMRMSALNGDNIKAGGNIIEFHVNRAIKDQVRVVLLKAGKKVGEQIMKEGDTFQTPWMGMKLFLASISFGAQNQIHVRAIDPTPGGNLPPSALEIQPQGADKPFWLVQGEVKKISVGGRNAFVVFSNETMALPFELQLNQFHKKNYPGTETPYSYESLVTNLTDQKQTLISMNEPLKVDNFTLYQASFNMTPGQKPISILSVNSDPGRWVKYLGSLILSLGVVIFTLMRSRFYRQHMNTKA